MADYKQIYDQHIALRDVLNHLNIAKKRLEEVMSGLSIESVSVIFNNNPVFYDGVSKDPNENLETFSTDRFITCQDLLLKTQTQIISAQERLLRLGVHHVRLPVREDIS